MFKGLVHDAKAAANSALLSYVLWAAVVIPFLIAAAFAMAAITLWLVDQFGAQTAYLIVAGGFALLGLVVWLIVRSRQQVAVEEERKDVAADTSMVTAESAVAAAQQIPAALMGLIGSEVSPETLVAVLRGLGRHTALIALVAAVGLILWPQMKKLEEEVLPASRRYDGRSPNGHDASANHPSTL